MWRSTNHGILLLRTIMMGSHHYDNHYFFNTPLQVGKWRSWTPNLHRSVKKCSLPSAFIKMSASWYYVGTYEGLIIPACNFSHTMWQSISMCFVHSWNTGFAAICKAARLSQKSRVGRLDGTFKSCIRYCNQPISKQLLSIVRYSASADDLDTFVCFFDFHEIIEEPRKMQYPDTDLRVVWQPPQSESQ